MKKSMRIFSEEMVREFGNHNYARISMVIKNVKRRVKRRVKKVKKVKKQVEQASSSGKIEAWKGIEVEARFQCDSACPSTCEPAAKLATLLHRAVAYGEGRSIGHTLAVVEPDFSDNDVVRTFGAITLLNLGLSYKERTRLAQMIVSYAYGMGSKST